jgi:hypothetical protein
MDESKVFKDRSHLKKHEGWDICQYCKDDYDTPHKQRLYRVGSKGLLMCGDCANQRQGDIDQMNYEGRFDE